MSVCMGGDTGCSEHYSNKYHRLIVDRIVNITQGWNARHFIEYWVNKEIVPILRNYEEETSKILKES